MGWFSKNKPTDETNSQPPKEAAIEIVAHQNARREAFREVKKANEQLNKLLVQNGFTLKIYLAAGGSHPQTKKGSI